MPNLNKAYINKHKHKKENFRGFRVSDFALHPKSKLGNLGKCSFTSNFDSCCNLRCKSDKKLTETKT